jgi:putative membrane protein
MYWHGDVSWWGWALMTFGMVAFWGLVAWLIVTVFRSADRPAGSRAERPEDILDERYARGEIDTDEYQHRRDALGGRTPASKA